MVLKRRQVGASHVLPQCGSGLVRIILYSLLVLPGARRVVTFGVQPSPELGCLAHRGSRFSAVNVEDRAEPTPCGLWGYKSAIGSVGVVSPPPLSPKLVAAMALYGRRFIRNCCCSAAGYHSSLCQTLAALQDPSIFMYSAMSGTRIRSWRAL